MITELFQFDQIRYVCFTQLIELPIEELCFSMTFRDMVANREASLPLPHPTPCGMYYV
jgi:hypothetical protein